MEGLFKAERGISAMAITLKMCSPQNTVQLLRIFDSINPRIQVTLKMRSIYCWFSVSVETISMKILHQ